MGQYYLIVNPDKRQYLHPHKFGQGLKLLEFGCGSIVTSALVLLLADGNGRGGGDLRVEEGQHPIVGSWAGDRIVVAGDYADEMRHVPQDLVAAYVQREYASRLKDIKAGKHYFSSTDELERYKADLQRTCEQSCNLYSVASEFFTDVSEEILLAMCADRWLREDVRATFANNYFAKDLSPRLEQAMGLGDSGPVTTHGPVLRPDLVIVPSQD